MELQVGCSNLRAQRVGAVATPLFPTLGVPLLLSLPVITGRPRAASPHHVAGRSGNVIAETGRSCLAASGWWRHLQGRQAGGGRGRASSSGSSSGSSCGSSSCSSSRAVRLGSRLYSLLALACTQQPTACLSGPAQCVSASFLLLEF
eukprot:COSAG01_NODE_678_length_14293_cov_14.229388_12_plen_147_part_00